jgi:hypothetical protein
MKGGKNGQKHFFFSPTPEKGESQKSNQIERAEPRSLTAG